jgi:hypothetical protein
VTGISGRIIVGPTCPIVGPQCPPAASEQGLVRIERGSDTRGSGGGQFVERVASDRNGAFAAHLDPGAYVLAVEKTHSGYPLAKPQQVRVEAGVVSYATLTLDTGIR